MPPVLAVTTATGDRFRSYPLPSLQFQHGTAPAGASQPIPADFDPLSPPKSATAALPSPSMDTINPPSVLPVSLLPNRRRQPRSQSPRGLRLPSLPSPPSGLPRPNGCGRAPMWFTKPAAHQLASRWPPCRFRLGADRRRCHSCHLLSHELRRRRRNRPHEECILPPPLHPLPQLRRLPPLRHSSPRRTRKGTKFGLHSVSLAIFFSVRVLYFVLQLFA